MEQELQTVRSGYLNKSFMLFHITDISDQTFDFHYHEFNKIIIFLSGNVTYVIEGKSYKLRPWDILLINHHDVHRPIIAPNETYERIIIWADSSFIEQFNKKDCDLTTCFQLADKRSINLIRTANQLQQKLKDIILSLDNSFHSKEFGNEVLSNALFLELLVYLNRIHTDNTNAYSSNTTEGQQAFDPILQYIKENLSTPLSVDQIADQFYMNKYYLMHKFKETTGYTLHNYIIKKRLFQSLEYIREGLPIAKASELSGFEDYSSYLRAFKKTFHQTPREFLTQL